MIKEWNKSLEEAERLFITLQGTDLEGLIHNLEGIQGYVEDGISLKHIGRLLHILRNLRIVYWHVSQWRDNTEDTVYIPRVCPQCETPLQVRVDKWLERDLWPGDIFVKCDLCDHKWVTNIYLDKRYVE